MARAEKLQKNRGLLATALTGRHAQCSTKLPKRLMQLKEDLASRLMTAAAERDALEDSCGDVMFVCVNLARFIEGESGAGFENAPIINLKRVSAAIEPSLWLRP